MLAVKDVLRDRIVDILAAHFNVKEDVMVDHPAVNDIIDECFSVCGISEKEQNEEWD